MQKRRVTKQIENKVFNKENVIRVVDLILEAWKKSESGSKRFNITLNSEDNETFEFEDQELEKIILDDKRIKNIDISFINYRGNKDSIDIHLLHGNQTCGGSNYVIKSSDSSWINDIRSRLDEVLETIAPQSAFFIKYRKLVVHLLALMIGVVIFKILLFFSVSNYNPNTTKLNLSPIAYYPLLFFLIYFLGLSFEILFLSRVLNYIENLWPSIEFDFGPEHEKREKKKRETIKWLISALIIPIILSIVFRLI